MGKRPGDRATVAIAHTNEKHRTIRLVLALVREALSHLGGIETFVKAGQTVLIKPNNTVYYSAEEGCTTDPLLVGAVVRLVKEAGAARVIVGESSGDALSSIECMNITGIAAAAAREGAEVIDLGSDDTPNRQVRIPNGRVIHEVPLPAPVLDADVIISLPKAKTHHIEPISGALKLWVGLVNQTWRHFNHGDRETAGRFMDIMTVARPALTIVDALICGEGDGPLANLPRWCGAILASTDPVAIDVSIARLLGRDPEGLNFAKEAEARGLGVRGPIEYAGMPIEQVAFQAWPGHQGFDYLPVNWLVGEGVTLEGSVGHVKSVLDSMLRRGELSRVLFLKGTPTIMIGETEDPHFEEHLRQGPYVVVDDCARPKYRDDPRVHFIPGHPVLRGAMPGLMKGLGVSVPAKVAKAWQDVEGWGTHTHEHGSAKRKAAAVGATAAAVAFAGLGAKLLIGLARNRK